MPTAAEATAAFAAALAAFHVSEHHLSKRQHGRGEWLLSKPYAAAMATALLEHGAESWFCPTVKQAAIETTFGLGVVLVVAGEAMRKAAILQAGPSFTLQVQSKRRQEHTLVTNGVYRFVRHPAYLGWTAWAVGTQLVLGNPICTLLFYVLAHRFFKDRIPEEERHLRAFFGARWDAYASATPTYLPGIA